MNLIVVCLILNTVILIAAFILAIVADVKFRKAMREWEDVMESAEKDGK